MGLLTSDLDIIKFSTIPYQLTCSLTTPTYEPSSASFAFNSKLRSASFSPSMSNNQKPVLAFFGATGGVAGSALALALNAGYTCTARMLLPTSSSFLFRLPIAY